MSTVLKNVYKSFGERDVIKNFSYEFRESNIYILTSPSGSGKTTLLRLLAGLEKCDSGDISISEEISFMFQEERLFKHLTGPENVRAVLPDMPLGEIDAAVKTLIPEYSPSVKVEDYSGGMKRRLSLIRACEYAAFYDKKLLLLDEPFSGLDEERIRQASEYIEKAAKGRTVIIASHQKALLTGTDVWYINSVCQE